MCDVRESEKGNRERMEVRVTRAPGACSNSWEVWRAATERERDVMGHRQKTEDWLACGLHALPWREAYTRASDRARRCQSVAALPRHGRSC
jgi:hypothetical protein